MTPSNRRAHSLRNTLLVPMVGVGALVTCLGLFAVHLRTRSDLEQALYRRAELIANMIIYAGEAASSTAELQRLVSSLGADRDVLEIFVAGGDPLTVRACTRGQWRDKPVSSLPNEEYAADLKRAIALGAPSTHINEADGLFDYSAPMQLERLGDTQGVVLQGAVMVHLDIHPLRASVRRHWQQLAVTFASALTLLLALGFWRIQRQILSPLSKIARHLSEPDVRSDASWPEEARMDEIGALAHALRQAFVRSRAAHHELEHQKFAFDQHCIVTVATVRGEITYVNDKFCAISKYSREEILGQDHRILNSGHHPKTFFTAMWRALLRGQVWHGEIRNRAKDGSFYWVDTTIVPVLAADGAPLRFIAIRTDITERRLAAEALQVAKLAAEAASEAKSGFLANMSHEIRTPMNAVLGMTTLLLETELKDNQRELLEILRANGEALLEIINEILDYSRIEANKLELEMRPFNVRETIESAIDLFGVQAAQKRLDLVVRVDDEVPRYVIGDSSRVRQILVNLVGNALKFTERGEVEVVLASRKHGSGEVTLTLSVRDTGVGIPAEKLHTLFKSFSQVDASTTRRFGGSGLGLAICKRLGEMMGGRVWVESVEGQGSTFYFEHAFPLGPESTGPTSAGPAVSFHGKHVLVVDDNPAVRGFIAHELEKRGASVKVAATLEQGAHALCSSVQTDLVLVDDLLPDCAPSELEAAMRGQLGAPTVPILLLNPERNARANSRGFSEQLSKPLKSRALIDAVSRVLGQKTMRVASAKPLHGSAFDATLATRYPLRILLAEDNPVNQKVAAMSLARLGYQITIVNNGAEAVEAAAAQPYDLILMDVHMPDVDGLEATRRIRRLSSDLVQHPRIVALTASVFAEERAAAVQAGMDDLIGKPLRIEELQQTIIDAAQAATVHVAKRS